MLSLECGTHSSISLSFFVCRYSNMINFVTFTMLLHNAQHSADIKAYLAPRRWWSKNNSRWLTLSRIFGLEKSAHDCQRLPGLVRCTANSVSSTEFHLCTCAHGAVYLATCCTQWYNECARCSRSALKWPQSKHSQAYCFGLPEIMICRPVLSVSLPSRHDQTWRQIAAFLSFWLTDSVLSVQFC